DVEPEWDVSKLAHHMARTRMGGMETATEDAKGEHTEQQAGVRIPVAVVLGHVDEGKTTFLDRVRGTNV
ncbi:unnamed protein product, partial [Amoebophrya sp. A25]